MAQRLYEMGPRIGQPVISYPRMLYRGKAPNLENLIVQDEREEEEAKRKGWGPHPGPNSEQVPFPTKEEAEKASSVSVPELPRRGPGRPRKIGVNNGERPRFN